METILTVIGVGFVLSILIFSEPGIALIDWGIRKYLKLKGRKEELKILEENEGIPRFRWTTKTSIEKKGQIGLLILILLISTVILGYFYTYSSH